MADDTILITGATGFIAQHNIIAALAAGFRVRTAIRSLDRSDQVRAYLAKGGAEPGDRLSFVETDLLKDEGWAEAAQGCIYAIHSASSTPSGDYASEEEWVRPAVDGNLRLLRAARAAGVKRVVLTSAFGAIGAGQASPGRPFTEEDWSDLNGDIAPYQKSKTLAERAAWDFIAEQGGGMELATINPTAVMGPALGPDTSHSLMMLKGMLEGQPGQPRIKSCFVDVRDVADLHIRAMTNPAAAGERFLATSGEALWLADVAKILKERLGEQARKVSTMQVPNIALKAKALVDPKVKGLLPLLGVDLSASGDKAKRMLGWNPRPPADAIEAAARSMIQVGLIDV
ncbi:NAD-dependent epimerase/dehydratase family protein [Rhizobium sp. AB2/73]|uniref:NAD-dependent epimerase/dehydratase family protein n=1 Tax=Rhizobium TaxID=379 RepID=UPI000DDAEAF3|nr:NAD-dependent epimerase/dehydratase family protein [Rhizobium sp. AB2/73]QYA13239.1 NAD-dependent epimerase/dehydratase family protein [Rhizobium sp. AB2/73]UEQ80828.1 NAD-dependent epimerase/dehydratase family protein [Rhizobium sp. AB2/73]